MVGYYWLARDHLKTAPEKIELVLNLWAAGVDPSAIMYVCGHCEDTIHRWLSRVGDHSGWLHDYYCHDLFLAYLQLDELHTNIRQVAGKSWLWAVIDPTTKIIPSADRNLII